MDSIEWTSAGILTFEGTAGVGECMTNEYYQSNADSYFTETISMKMDPVLEKFALRLVPGGHVLDVGCGSGRDSFWFLSQGFQVTAFDSCRELAKLSSNHISQEVLVKDYREISWTNKFDGIWACASLLHCPKSDINNVLMRLVTALKIDGFLYVSFKEGEGESIDFKRRFFNFYTMSALKKELKKVPGVVIDDFWENTIKLRGTDQTWVNAIVHKRR